MPFADSASLRATFALASRLEAWFTIVVLVGIAIELVTLWFFSKDVRLVERTLLLVATFVIAVGVAGEYIFGKAAGDAASQLQRLSDERVATSERDVAALQVRVAKEQRIATQAAAHAADLGVTLGNLQAFVRARQALATRTMASLAAALKNDRMATASAVTRLNADRMKLEAAREAADTSVRLSAQNLAQVQADAARVQADASQVALLLQQEQARYQQLLAIATPRSLSTGQQADFVRRVSAFAPMRVDIIAAGDTNEIANLARIVAEALTQAGWKPKVWEALGGSAMGARGIPMYVRVGAPARTRAAAKALEQALLAEGIAAKILGTFDSTAVPGAVVGPPWDTHDVAEIRLIVGAKP